MALCSAGPSAPLFAAVPPPSAVSDTAAAAVTAAGNGCKFRQTRIQVPFVLRSYLCGTMHAGN